MLLCGLCVNSINILFRDLRGFLPFCLSSGDPGISLWAVGQHHFVYRKKQQAEERGPRPHPKLHFLCGETCQDGALTCIWKREQHFQPLENRRWSVKLEPWHATLTGHPPSTRPTPSSKTVTDLGPARRDGTAKVDYCYKIGLKEARVQGGCSYGSGRFKKKKWLKWDQPQVPLSHLSPWVVPASHVSLTTAGHAAVVINMEKINEKKQTCNRKRKQKIQSAYTVTCKWLLANWL